MAKYYVWKGSAPRTFETALEAELVSDLTLVDYIQLDTAWSRFKLERSPVVPPDNDDWEWYTKVSQAAIGSQRTFALKYENDFQGMIMVALPARVSRRPRSTNPPVLYIEYLETAPWNQPAYVGDKIRFLGVGTALIALATSISLELGCNGRLGLHSLPSAEGFYIHMGFASLGYDPEEKLVYFERGE